MRHFPLLSVVLSASVVAFTFTRGKTSAVGIEKVKRRTAARPKLHAAMMSRIASM